jgi:hypothetical protein
MTSRDYGRPYRPPPIAILDRLAPTRKLSSGGLIDAARAATDLTRFDDDDSLEALDRLCESLESEARLTAAGRVLTRSRLVTALSNRLRASDLFRRHPVILDTPVTAPLFVTGLQRTGTTKMHRLLAADPSARPLYCWEALNPAPWPPRWWHPHEPRLLMATLAERTLRYLAPDFFAVHPIEAMSPEEEVVILDHTFLSTVSEASYHVPSFALWLESQDHSPAYRYLRRTLQLLQWQRSGRWVLKTPHHMEHIDTLFDVFPDAHIVQMHRDPRTTVASFCSMVAHGRGIFSDSVDASEVGRHWLAKIGRMLRECMDARTRHSDAFIDVQYQTLMAEPMHEAARVYEHAGLTMSDAARAAMRASLSTNQQHKYGRHRYALADFGLDEATVDAATHVYRQRYGFA